MEVGREAGDLLRNQGGRRSGIVSTLANTSQGIASGIVSLVLLGVWFLLLWRKSGNLRLLQRSAAIGLLASLIAWGAGRLFQGLPWWQNQQQLVPFGYLTLLILSTAFAVWLTGKVWAASWPEPLWAVLPAATFLAVYRVWPSFWSGETSWHMVSWYTRDFFLQVGVFSAGAFLFLILPQARGSRVPKILPGRVFLAALVSALAVLGAEMIFGRISGGLGSFLGLITLVVGGIAAVAAIGLAILLTIFRRERIGGMIGLWGNFFWVCIWILWMLLGAPWFP